MNDENMPFNKGPYLSKEASARLEAMRAKYDPQRRFVSFLDVRVFDQQPRERRQGGEGELVSKNGTSKAIGFTQERFMHYAERALVISLLCSLSTWQTSAASLTLSSPKTLGFLLNGSSESIR